MGGSGKTQDKTPDRPERSMSRALCSKPEARFGELRIDYRGQDWQDGLRDDPLDTGRNTEPPLALPPGFRIDFRRRGEG
jgi:hypothetical protein